MEKGNKRMAVLVGCNYEDTPNELHGCINDVVAMRDMLVNRFGFDLSNIELLTDAPRSSVMPTGLNIKSVLHEMVDKAKPGDVLYFHYSGHGARILLSRPGYPHWQDEAIVPCDYNIITAYLDFRQLVNCVPKGASLTILSDSCHSGGLIEKEKEQIGPLTVADKTTPALGSSIRPKWVAFQDILSHLTSLTGLNTSDIGAHLLESFGNDASLKFRMSREATELINHDEGILLSGCQANDTSANMNPSDQNGGDAYGAFSNAVQIVLHNHSGKLSNREVAMLAREVLKEQGFEQHPCLYCSDENADATFLSQPYETKFILCKTLINSILIRSIRNYFNLCLTKEIVKL